MIFHSYVSLPEGIHPQMAVVYGMFLSWWFDRSPGRTEKTTESWPMKLQKSPYIHDIYMISHLKNPSLSFKIWQLFRPKEIWWQASLVKTLHVSWDKKKMLSDQDVYWKIIPFSVESSWIPLFPGQSPILDEEKNAIFWLLVIYLSYPHYIPVASPHMSHHITKYIYYIYIYTVYYIYTLYIIYIHCILYIYPILSLLYPHYIYIYIHILYIHIYYI